MRKSEFPKTYWKNFKKNLAYHTTTKVREPKLKVGKIKFRSPVGK